MGAKKKFILKILWSAFIIGWGTIIAIFYLIYNGSIGYMPAVEQLQNPIDKFASQIYASDGSSMGTFAEHGTNRILVKYKNLSPWIVKALIATEDARFREHSGIDFRAFSRAVIKTGILRQKRGGGSTITQQLAKQLFSPRTDSRMARLFQKPIEWMIALKLERYYTKDEILTLYLNQFDFLYNAIGIKQAARTYFNKDPKDLNLNEAATLVGMCKNPAIFNPILNPEKALKRRNVVLGQMLKEQYLTEQERAKHSKYPLNTNFHPKTINSGIAPYFRDWIRRLLTAKKPDPNNYNTYSQAQYSADSLEWERNPLYGFCNKHRKADGSPYDLYSDGLKIYTTLDTKLQEYAESSMAHVMGSVLQPAFNQEQKSNKNAPFDSRLSGKIREEIITRSIHNTDRWIMGKKYGLSDTEIMASFKQKRKMQLWSWSGSKTVTTTPLDSLLYMKKFLRAGMIAIEPMTGYVLAYVGGINYDYFKYDMVTQSKRQVGSTIKPFLYSMAMMSSIGLTPCSPLTLEPVTLHTRGGKPYTPRGHSKNAGSTVTIGWGLQHSDNWVTAYIMSQTSPSSFIQLLRSYGLTGYMDPEPSICMGTPEVSIAEMTSAYTTFINGGVRASIAPILRIEDRNGNVIQNFTPQIKDVIPQDAAWKTLNMLQMVVNGGTGSRLRSTYGLSINLGGKTGTTQNNSDTWFIGFTPDIVAGVWVGGEDRTIRFRNSRIGQGAGSALPIFGEFIRKIYSDTKSGYTNRPFDIPSDFDPCNGGNFIQPIVIPPNQDSTILEATPDSTEWDEDIF